MKFIWTQMESKSTFHMVFLSIFFWRKSSGARTGYLQAKISTGKKTIRARLIKKRSPLWYMVISPSPRWQCIIIQLYSDAWWNMHPTYQKSYFIFLFYLFISPMWWLNFRLRKGSSIETETKTKHTNLCWNMAKKERKKIHTVRVNVILLTPEG